ncbi:MAG: DEAD/DEAH box helicase [Synergistaceae bacterium]|nr:DEAD/DEAH box helicase [Synergistaceae bacterium]
MFFDEQQRKKLLSIYQSLSENEQNVYRVLALTFVPVSPNSLKAILNAIEGKAKWSAPKCEALLENWEKLGLAGKLQWRLQCEFWYCSRLMTEIGARELLARGEYDRYNKAVEDTLSLRREEQANFYPSVSHYLRMTRKIFYKNDLRAYENLFIASIGTGPDCYDKPNAKNPFVEILANPLEMERLSSLPAEIGSAAFFTLLAGAFDNAALFSDLFVVFDAYRQRNAKDPALAETWAEFAALSGRLEDAVRALETNDSPEKYSLAALLALTRGEKERALALYEEGLKLIRKIERKRKVGYLSWTGAFYPILLLSAGEDAKKALDYLEGTRARFGGRIAVAAFRLLRFFFLPGTKNDEFFQNRFVFESRPERCVNAFFFLLYAYWFDAEETRGMKPLAAATFRQLAALRMNLLAAETAALIRELWPRSAKDCAKFPDPPRPLKDLLSRQSEWERSLKALSGLTSKGDAAAKGAKRFVWEISWPPPKGKHVSSVALVPMEQTLQTSGWSKGKNVALRRLCRRADSIPSMTEQDHRAAAAVREEYQYRGTSYYIDVPQALAALSGHPCLFRAGDGSRVEVAVDEPRLTTVSEGEGYRMRLSPFPAARNAPQYIITEDGPNCLRVTLFEERHVKVADILSEEGLFVPARAHGALLKTLGSLASIVTIHSDVEGIEANAEQVEADSRVYVQIQPSDEGLDVEMVVRPLGPGGAPCRPGVGGGSIFGLSGARRVQTRRDLEAEKDALMTTVRACPALLSSEQLSNERWRLASPEMSLEFLTQIQNLGDSVAVEWPKGETIRVRPPVSLSSMNIAVRSAQDWFSVSGELRVDEKLILSMKDLMDLLKAGHGRFLPLGDGQFLALTKEFRRRLEALSALGDPRGGELRVPPLSAGLLAPLADEAGSFKGDAEWKKRMQLLDEAAKLSPSVPSTFKGELRNYQVEGYQWLTRLSHWGAGACLADDLGLGKTIQVLALLIARSGEKDGGPALVVAPTSVCANWIAEAGRFAPTLNMRELRYGDREKTLSGLEPFDVVVATYGLLQNEIERIAAIRWHTIVLDEAQAIKNMGTKRSASAMKLEGDFRVATTGTPIENRLGELWNLFRFLNPHYLGSLESFSRRFAVPIERDGDQEAKIRLKRVIQPFILRRSKEQVLEELPPKTEITLRVEMKEEERAFYEMLRRSAVDSLTSPDLSVQTDRRFRIFAELMRLRRACCNASLAMPAEEGQGRAKVFPSAKLEAFSQILSELRENNHKALVFSQFVDHLSLLRGYLDEEGIPYQYLDGSTSPHERAKRVAAFQAGEGDCFLISLKAGGTGLNLTAADYVIHMDPWWNPAVEEQASDRAHRIGQDRPVTVYRVVAKDTIEEKIVDLHAWKRDLAESLLDESEAPLRLSAEEMLELIREAR